MLTNRQILGGVFYGVWSLTKSKISQGLIITLAHNLQPGFLAKHNKLSSLGKTHIPYFMQQNFASLVIMQKCKFESAPSHQAPPADSSPIAQDAVDSSRGYFGRNVPK